MTNSKAEEEARELVSVLPKKGGYREGMYHDILHILFARDQRIKELSDKVAQWEGAYGIGVSKWVDFVVERKANMENYISDLQAKIKELQEKLNER